MDEPSTSPSPPPIKRVRVVYGRQREPAPVASADMSFSTLSSSSHHSIFDSMRAKSSPDTSVEDPDLDASSQPEFEFAWRQRLKEIDSASDLASVLSPTELDVATLADEEDNLFKSQSLGPESLEKSTRETSSAKASLSTRLAARAHLLSEDSNSASGSRDNWPKLPILASPDFTSGALDFSQGSVPRSSSPCLDGVEDPPSAGALHASTAASEDKSLPLTIVRGKGKARAPVVRPLVFEAKPRQNKIKPPTKNELRETEIQRARLKAEQGINIERTETRKYTWNAFFDKISAKGLVPSHEVSSDPIQPFSSPSAFDQDYEVSVGQESPPEPKAPQVSWNGDDDDDEMPSVRKLGQRAQQLAELKRRALQHQSIPGSEDDDDELMIVSVRREGSQEDRRRKSDTIGIGIAGGAIGSRSMAKVGIMGPLHKGKDGLGSARESKRNSTTLQTLNDQLWQKVEEAQRREVARKEDEWENRGGRLKERDQGGKTQDALRLYAEKAKQNIDGAVTLAHDESDDGDDEDWAPRDDSSPYASIGRRSASLLSGPGSDSDGEDAASQATDVDDADDKENSLPRLRVPNRRVRRAVDSDDEDENYPTSRGRVLVPDTSLIIPFDASPGRSLTHRISHSSFETDNDEEKENEKARMWDKSEDKENKAVVRHDPFARTSRGFYPGILGDSSRSGIGIHRDQSASPGIPDSDDEPQSGDRGNRTPFKDLLKDRGDVSLSLGPDFAPSFIQRLTQPQPNLDACGSRLSTPSPKLKPLLNKTDLEELDREVQEDENAFALWKPALGSLFEDGTQLPSASGSHLMKDAESFESLSKLRRNSSPEGLPLTLDVGLAPALEVSDMTKKQADSIFEKEQGYLVDGFEEQRKKGSRREPEVYVNDHGFLTQTRPDVASPEIYRTLSPPPLQTQPYRSFPSARNIEESLPRRPLQTISFNEDAQEPSPRSPLLRLLRWDTDSAAVDDDKFVEGGYRSSGTPEPRKTLDAFAVLAQNAKRLQQREQKSLDRSKFVESEAVESDDDEMQGFGGFGAPADGENEETNGEDLDKALEGLVDDQEMNEDELGKEKILAKHQEHLAEDDKLIEKLHRDAVEGKLRAKRRNRGVEISEGSDESDDEHDREIRRKLRKKRKIDGDALEALGNNEDTRAFYDAYRQDLDDDDNAEFSHLQSNDMVIEGGHSELEADAEGDAETEAETERFFPLRMPQKRRFAFQHLEGALLDAEDASFLDDQPSDSEGQQHVRVQDTSIASKDTSTRRTRWDEVDFNDGLEHPINKAKDQDIRKLVAWAKGEAKARNAGTGRKAAVTRRSRTDIVAGGGSLRPGAPGTSRAGASADSRQEVRKPRVLTKAFDRSGRFA